MLSHWKDKDTNSLFELERTRAHSANSSSLRFVRLTLGRASGLQDGESGWWRVEDTGHVLELLTFVACASIFLNFFFLWNHYSNRLQSFCRYKRSCLPLVKCPYKVSNNDRCCSNHRAETRSETTITARQTNTENEMNQDKCRHYICVIAYVNCVSLNLLHTVAVSSVVARLPSSSIVGRLRRHQHDQSSYHDIV